MVAVASLQKDLPGGFQRQVFRVNKNNFAKGFVVGCVSVEEREFDVGHMAKVPKLILVFGWNWEKNLGGFPIKKYHICHFNSPEK